MTEDKNYALITATALGVGLLKSGGVAGITYGLMKLKERRIFKAREKNKSLERKRLRMKIAGNILKLKRSEKAYSWLDSLNKNKDILSRVKKFPYESNKELQDAIENWGLEELSKSKRLNLSTQVKSKLDNVETLMHSAKGSDKVKLDKLHSELWELYHRVEKALWV